MNVRVDAGNIVFGVAGIKGFGLDFEFDFGLLETRFCFYAKHLTERRNMEIITKEEVQELLKKLLEYYSIEEVASNVGRCGNTVWRWKYGKSLPSKCDFYCLKNMLNDISLTKEIN